MLFMLFVIDNLFRVKCWFLLKFSKKKRQLTIQCYKTKILLLYDNPIYFILFMKDESSRFSTTSGVVVSIHERGKQPSLFFNSLTASNSLATNIAVRKTEFNKLPYPYSECRKNPNTLLPTDSKYHRETLAISLYSHWVW
jgi:predicted metallopeptidase